MNPTSQPDTIVPPDVAPMDPVEPEGFAICPRCHVVDTAITNASLAAGGYWQCGRCGSKWDHRRLATVAAYAAWDLARQPRQPADDSARVAASTLVPVSANA